ncbi:MAG TPA: S8 family serine peptidase [Anaerolineae bacterium]|nr:S8 family serine peptidase [Anaerolineae bacterium]
MAPKISPSLENRMNTLANGEPIPIIVRHKTGLFSARAVVGGAAVRSMVGRSAALPPARSFNLFPGEALEVTAADIENLSQHEEVEYVWPDLPVHTCLNTSVPKISAPRVWAETGFRGQGIKVAVVDTGIDEAHPDFAGRIVASKSFVSSSPHDDNGHGTHVAGTIAGSGAKSGGKYVGVAPAARLYIAKVLRANGSGSMSTVMAGIEWAVLEQKVQIINLSLGGSGSCDGTDALSTLVDEAVRQAGVVVCVAAGNEGPDGRTIGSPGCARYVITVGAVDDNDRVARFSSRGPTADGRTKPDIVFPGVGIIAPRAANTRLGTIIEEGYIASDGTSMATPHASGVAALMLQANPHLTAEQVKTLMLAGAVNVIGALPNDQGVGRGDAFAAYQKAKGAATPKPKPQPQPQSPPRPQPQPQPRSQSEPQPQPPAPTPSQPTGCLAGLFGRRK